MMADIIARDISPASPRRWIGAGLALDGAAIAVFWFATTALTARPEPKGSQGPGVYDMLAFTLIPWLVHVLALPALFKRASPGFAWTKTAVYALFAPVLVVTLSFGIFGVMLVPMARFAIACARLAVPGLSHESASKISKVSFLLALFLFSSGAGAAVGLLIASLRKPGGSRRPLPPNVDKLGGLLGGIAAFVGLCVLGSLFGSPALFDPTLPNFPRLPTTLVAGLLALLPHLVLTARFNPPPAISASGAAPSAPSR